VREGKLVFYQRVPGGVAIAVKAQPGAKRVAIGPVLPAAPAPGWPEARLKIAISAPPEDGRANAAIIAALAAWLGVKPASITLTAGAAARDKRFLVTGAVELPEI
jgi:uncharacterized protein YggU (UPF0235/DUF167 family)